MKPFSDFYTSSNEKLDELLKEVIADEFAENEKLSSAEFAGKIISANRIITLDTLRVYHEWLSEQF